MSADFQQSFSHIVKINQNQKCKKLRTKFFFPAHQAVLQPNFHILCMCSLLKCVVYWMALVKRKFTKILKNRIDLRWSHVIYLEKSSNILFNNSLSRLWTQVNRRRVIERSIPPHLRPNSLNLRRPKNSSYWILKLNPSSRTNSGKIV